jgi:hypothetical protein
VRRLAATTVQAEMGDDDAWTAKTQGELNHHLISV